MLVHSCYCKLHTLHYPGTLMSIFWAHQSHCGIIFHLQNKIRQDQHQTNTAESNKRAKQLSIPTLLPITIRLHRIWTNELWSWTWSGGVSYRCWRRQRTPSTGRSRQACLHCHSWGGSPRCRSRMWAPRRTCSPHSSCPPAPHHHPDCWSAEEHTEEEFSGGSQVRIPTVMEDLEK